MHVVAGSQGDLVSVGNGLRGEAAVHRGDQLARVGAGGRACPHLGGDSAELNVLGPVAAVGRVDRDDRGTPGGVVACAGHGVGGVQCCPPPWPSRIRGRVPQVPSGVHSTPVISSRVKNCSVTPSDDAWEVNRIGVSRLSEVPCAGAPWTTQRREPRPVTALIGLSSSNAQWRTAAPKLSRRTSPVPRQSTSPRGMGRGAASWPGTLRRSVGAGGQFAMVAGRTASGPKRRRARSAAASAARARASPGSRESWR